MHAYFKDANPIFGMGCDSRGEGVVALQRSLWQETLPHILEDHMSKAGRLYRNTALSYRATARRCCNFSE